MTNSLISVPKSFTNGDVLKWFKQFNIRNKAIEWSNGTKALKLPTYLEGNALATWLELI